MLAPHSPTVNYLFRAALSANLYMLHGECEMREGEKGSLEVALASTDRVVDNLWVCREDATLIFQTADPKIFLPELVH